MNRSPLTAELQTYFDISDTRVRTGKAGLAVQLLNALATPIEESNRRVARESGRNFESVPLNIDHQGVYYRLQVPSSLVLKSDADGSLLPPLVEAFDGADWSILSLYDDNLPVPSGLMPDPDRESIPMSERFLFTVTGTGNPLQVACELPLPCRPVFELSGVGSMQGAVEIIIEGDVWPPNPWSPEKRTEVVLLQDAGYAKTHFTWLHINRVMVSGLPAGSLLKAAVFQSLFDYDIDDREFIDPMFRDARFLRHWRASGSLVEESYVLNRFAGHTTIQNYSTPGAVDHLALEPNTLGLLVASGSQLLYCDRREEMPDKLDRTALSVAPPFGLVPEFDIQKQSDFDSLGISRGSRFLKVSTEPYTTATTVSQYRFLVEFPDGSQRILTPEGSFATYTVDGGWRRGVPDKPVSMPLPLDGTYLVTLEMVDTHGDLFRDVAAYHSPALRVLASLPLNSVVPEVAGLGFDNLQRLWLWTGSFLVPAVFRYNRFAWDGGSRSLYLTSSYPQVRLT